MKGGTYTKTLAKIQVRGIFRIQDIRRNVLPKFIEICWRRPAGAHPDTTISRRVVGKSTRDNPERYCGWFEFTSLQRNLKEGHGRPCTYVCGC